MKIRKLNESDYLCFLNLIKDFRETTFNEEDFKSNLREIEKNGNIWVVEANGELLSTATIMYETKFIFNICKAAHIEDVCTKIEHRGKGYGKQLITYLINEARRKECYKVNLVCSKDTTYFYKKCNFEERGVHMSFLL